MRFRCLTLEVDDNEVVDIKKAETAFAASAFWSECRDSNSRPLEPHSSAIPNFATPGFMLAFPERLSILAHIVRKCKHYFSIFKIFFIRHARP